MASIPRYHGHFGEKQAERLLWRAGFGPKPGEAKRLAKKGMKDAIHSLTHPGKENFSGPKPKDGDGLPIAPYDAYGHDVLWWLDRMVRTNAPFQQRMALIWHDWFATGDVGNQRFSVDQAKMFREFGTGSFDKLLRKVTIDRAMLVWLSGIYNNKYAPNENYGRELMELFTLGVSDDSGYPYSEDDVREQARALTGWDADYRDDVGLVNFRFNPDLHDTGRKKIFGKTGNFDWEDSLKLVLEHKAHAPHFVDRLWSYFVPVKAPSSTRSKLISSYRRNREIRPIVEAILAHPLFYEGPSMVKPPVVQVAGMLRARRRGITTDSWTWLTDLAGQRLFRPPNVAGWDETRWLDTSTFRGRWACANEIASDENAKSDGSYSEDERPGQAIEKALRYWGNPTITKTTQKKLEQFARGVESSIEADWEESAYRGLRQNALRLLIATSPDLQTC
ncbi:DUF1800 domain-containing protein [soil metagenome]